MSKYLEQTTFPWWCAAILLLASVHALMSRDTTNALLFVVLANQIHADHEKELEARNAAKELKP